MSLSYIAKTIGESATLRLNETAAILRAKGDPVIHLGGGEPKGKAPLDAILAATSLLNSGEIRYTPADGIPALKQAIIRYTEEHYAWKPAPENVMASGGAKQAIMTALHTILNPQEEVIFPAPYWVSYPEMVKLVGAVPVAVQPEDGSFIPRLQDIEQVVGSYTRAVILNSPNNPSGAVYPEEFIADVVEFCERRDLYLIMDDIYHRLIFDGREPINPLRFAKDRSENSKLIIINGVSKQYAMTGFRIGWSVGQKDLVKVMANIQSHQSGNPGSLSQHAAVAAIHGAQGSVKALRLTLQESRDVLVGLLREIPGLEVDLPEGTFYCFADFRNFDGDSTRLAARLLEKVQVVTVPGVEFGMEGFLRLSYCGPVEDVKEGVRRMKWLLDADGPDTLEARGKVYRR